MPTVYKILGQANPNANVTTNIYTVPASNSAPGIRGQIVWDSGNVYVCVATNTWKRASLSSF